ncbi:MAG: AAA family ATPase [Gallionella sp.]
MNVAHFFDPSARSGIATSNVTHVRQLVQVRKCRSWGCATVDLVNLDGSIKKRDKTLVVKFPEYAREAATDGSLWEVSGNEYLNQFVVNGFLVSEYTIDAENIKFLRPSGRMLSRWISSNIRGIGSVIANRLVRVNNLSALIENCDRDALLDVAGMSSDRVQRLFEQWPDESLYKTIEWLEGQQLPLGLGNKLVAIFGAEAIEKVKTHPFLLMAMGVSFEKTMQIVHELNLSMSDNCVAAGVALHVTVRFAAKTGSTVIDSKTLVNACSHVIKSPAPESVGDIGVEEGLLVKVKDGYQVYGKALMEAAVAQFLVDAHMRPSGANALLAAWEKGLARGRVAEALTAHESSLEFELTGEQREAVISAVMAPVCCISGGAGTGKTTILNAILGVFNVIAEGIPCYQMAVAGRAAQRMAESTGRPAQTIAKFIVTHLRDKKSDLPPNIILVIDEASMVDLLSMYKLIGILPSATRILFVGDASQLPPVGDGLIFHALSDTPFPFFKLTQVKRQSELSGVHRFATAIRESKLELPKRTQKSLLESEDCSIESNSSITRLVDLWLEAGGIGNIVLSPIKKGELGVDNINAQLQQAAGLNRPALYYRNESRGWIPWITSTGAQLLEGDPILVVVNNYDEEADIRNGDLGIITEVFDMPKYENGALGVMEINGVAIFVTSDILVKLQLGYAVTIHKSQGSEWPTCFVMLPSEASHMIDQTLLYTAVTRPIKRLVMIGDNCLIEQAIRRGSLALERKTYLRERILVAAIMGKESGRASMRAA